MKKQTTELHIEEWDPEVIGDASVIERFFAMPKEKEPYLGDALANHIHLLMRIHPKVKQRFGASDLGPMTVAAKELLLSQINEVLGIPPVRFRSKTKSVKRPAGRSRRVGRKQAALKK